MSTSPVPRAAAEGVFAPPRFVVGIDLGTTNSAMAFVDTHEAAWRVQTFAIPQLTAPGTIEYRDTLPSCHYQAAEGELPATALALPWTRTPPLHAVGFFARDHGALTPGRLVASAKSWLCHGGVDRTADLLPWHAPPDVERLSPGEASARFLKHLADAWEYRFPGCPLAQQDVVITLPASFDEVARELTVKAAARAGLPRVVLIEEPQAAFYAWIHRHSGDWEQLVSPGQKILVCDIGGGTSDFTLIRVRRGEGGKVQFHRVAVGEHLILGGDNQDLALAHFVENRLTGGGKLEPRQWAVLIRVCRQVKETLLSADAPQSLTLTLPGAGSRLMAGGLQIELQRNEVRELLVDGFFPRVKLDDKPVARRSGFQEFGLPYAPDAAVTRYLAAFLTAHRYVDQEEEAGGAPASLSPGAARPKSRRSHGAPGAPSRSEPQASQVVPDPARPDLVLFNGGVFASPLLRGRLLEVLSSWFSTPQQPWQPIVLDNERLDLAVAQGAAYYGMVRRGQGVRIAGGLARTYYIGIESDPPAAVCLAPAKVEPGQDVHLADRVLRLLVSQPVEFPLYVSSTRLVDPAGALVAIDREQMRSLPPLRTVIRTGKRDSADTVPVTLHARLTEIGTLDVWCSEENGKRSWRLQFDVRSATQTDVAAHESAAEQQGFLDESVWLTCRETIERTFGAGKGKSPGDPPDVLPRRLTEATGMPRDDWPSSLLRRMGETLLEFESGRGKSPAHEARWINLLGFCLRPGFGMALDDWRVAETWRCMPGRLAHPTPACRAELLILWRRVAGGLNSGQQKALAEPLLAPLRQEYKQLTSGKGRGGPAGASSHESAETWRLLAALELLGTATKIELGQMILQLLSRKRMESIQPALAWALGRLGARVPQYGPLNTVLPAEEAAAWLGKLLQLADDRPAFALAAMQLARRTDDRYRDLPEKVRREVATWLEGRPGTTHFADLVRHGGTLDRQEQGLVFGESLPKGLRLM
jgi:molecular chaperone DnaK (HSP70)